MKQAPKLETKSLCKSFDGKQILSNINIQVYEKELISLLGISGSGKTTLFNLIAGILPPDEGAVYLKGQNITNCPGKVSYMLQKDLLLPYKSIVDNVALPLIIKGEKRKIAREKAASYFQEFGLSGTEQLYPHQLSGGMRQRAALLRTYLFSHELALLDEPFSALDTLTKSTMHQWYLSILEKIQLSTIFITHDIDEAILLSDRIYILSGSPGQISQELLIKEPKPRGQDFLLSKEFLEYKKQIISCLSLG